MKTWSYVLPSSFIHVHTTLSDSYSCQFVGMSVRANAEISAILNVWNILQYVRSWLYENTCTCVSVLKYKSLATCINDEMDKKNKKINEWPWLYVKRSILVRAWKEWERTMGISASVEWRWNKREYDSLQSFTGPRFRWSGACNNKSYFSDIYF